MSAAFRPQRVPALANRTAALLCAVGVLLAIWIEPLNAQDQSPRRIVSLNLCTDQILVDLVPRERIAAVTHLGADGSVSAVPGRLEGLPTTHGAAEDVLAHDPDLVIAGTYTTGPTVDLLRRLGRRVVVVPLPQTIAGVRLLINEIATAVDMAEEGKRLIAEMDARIDRVRASTLSEPMRPNAIIYQINNYVVGRDSLVDEALRVAGFNNAGGGVTTFANGKTELESIIARPPDLIVLATQPDAYRTAVADNIRHPALTQLMQKLPSLVLPWPLWLCGTHHIATAIEKLSEARLGLIEHQRIGQ